MKGIVYFIIVLVIYLTTHYVIECIESGLVMNPVNVITGRKIAEAISFSVIMLVLWIFSPKEKSVKKKEN